MQTMRHRMGWESGLYPTTGRRAFVWSGARARSWLMQLHSIWCLWPKNTGALQAKSVRALWFRRCMLPSESRPQAGDTAPPTALLTFGDGIPLGPSEAGTLEKAGAGDEVRQQNQHAISDFSFFSRGAAAGRNRNRRGRFSMLAAKKPPDFFMFSVFFAWGGPCVMRHPAAGRASSLMLLLALSAASAASIEGLLLVRSSSSGVRTAAARLARRPLHTASGSCTSGGTRVRPAFACPAAAAAAAVAFNNRSRSTRGVLAAASSRPIARAATMSSTAAADTDTVTLDTLKFDNQVIRELPVDPIPDNYVRRVENACFSKVSPDPVVKPVIVAASNAALALLGLPAEEGERDDAAEYFSGECVYWGVSVSVCVALGQKSGTKAVVVDQKGLQ